MTSKELKDRAKELEDNDIEFGLRYTSQFYSPGQELYTSLVWDGDDSTDDEAPGTCCFNTWEQVTEYAKYLKGQIAIITGERAVWGTDFAGEKYLPNAKVDCVIDWRSGNSNKTEKA